MRDAQLDSSIVPQEPMRSQIEVGLKQLNEATSCLRDTVARLNGGLYGYPTQNEAATPATTSQGWLSDINSNIRMQVATIRETLQNLDPIVRDLVPMESAGQQRR